MSQIIDPVAKEYLPESNVIEIYDYYDSRPVLLSFKDNNGLIYITVMIQNPKAYKKWMSVSISPQKFELAQQNKIELRDIFLDAESGFVYVVKIPNFNEKLFMVEVLQCNNIERSLLTPPGEFLHP